MADKQAVFRADEVWSVARAMLERAIDEEVSCGMNCYNICRHCDARVWWQDDSDTIKHETDCLVLVARDLLTGAPNGT